MNELLELAPAPSVVEPEDHRPDIASQHGGPETFPAARAYFAHPNALIDAGVSIGKGSRIWAFAHLATGAIVGNDCNICDHTFLEGGVRLGHRVTVKCGVYLWNGVVVEDDVFIGPAAVFTNDDRPRSKKYLTQDLTTLLREGCSIGANSTTLPNVTIGRWAMVGAGAVVTRSVPDYALVTGNPARWRAWVCRCGEKLPPALEGVLNCACGLSYKQIAEREIRAIATNGPVHSWTDNMGRLSVSQSSQAAGPPATMATQNRRNPAVGETPHSGDRVSGFN